MTSRFGVGVALDGARHGLGLLSGKSRCKKGHGLALASRPNDMSSIVEEGTESSRQPPLEPWVRDFVDSATDPVVAFDGAGRVAWLNPAAESLLGRSSGDSVGEPIGELLPGLPVETRPGPATLALELFRRDGERLPLRVTLSTLGRVAPPLCLARLQDLRVGRPLDALLTALSHELRSPLQAILSWAQLLRGSPTMDPFTERAFLAIERNVRWQVDVLEDILEMSQLLAGELPLELQPTLLSPFLEEVVQEFAEDTAARGIRLTRTVEAVEPQVLGDRRALRSMARSLIAHSLRHGSEGGSIDIDLRRAGSFLQLTVREAGSEPKPATLPEQDPSRRGSTTSIRQFEGLGVGLMKTQRLVEMHGGNVWAESEGAGRGARFVVSLPLATGNPTEA